MFSIVVISFFIIGALAQNSESFDNVYGVPENPCTTTGGVCIKSSECEESLKASPGLCPSQRSEGFECCYGMPKSETRCQKLGGQCFPYNECKNINLHMNRAKDCAEEEVCCILV